jgi:phage anti-repressor protein
MTDRIPGAPAPLSVQPQLIPVFTGHIGGRTAQVCDGRTLHTFLKVHRDFPTWIKSRIDEYGFIQDEDYSPVLGNRSDGLPGKPRTDYHLGLDMAKELAMVENNARGREARRYFISCERKLLEAHGQPPAAPAIPPSAWGERLRRAAVLADHGALIGTTIERLLEGCPYVQPRPYERPEPSRRTDAAAFEDKVVGKIQALLTERPGERWTSRRLETTHGGIAGRFGVGQKRLRYIVRMALQRGDLALDPETGALRVPPATH